MNTNKFSYPIFKVEDNVETWEGVLAEAIPEINPLYFEKNPRFRGLGKIKSKVMLDYMSIYEEGDWWVLTVIKAMSVGGQSKYLFLPLKAEVTTNLEVPIKETLPPGLEDIAFGLETNSHFYGIRHWKILDASTDVGFHVKILNLFRPWNDQSQNHVNAYTEIHESGIGKFIFHSNRAFEGLWDPTLETSLELTNTGDTIVKYGKSYRLIFNKALSETGDIATRYSSQGILGSIIYSAVQENRELLVAILKE